VVSEPPEPDPAEVQRLRDEVASLREELATAHTEPLPKRRRDSARWRSLTAVTLIVLACLLAPLAVVAVWASHEVSDANRYVQTVAPLAENPALQNAVADDITNQITRRVDINSLTNQVLTAISNEGLSPQAASTLRGLSGPIASGVQSFLHTSVAKIVESQAFATAWQLANRQAHQQLVALLSGKQHGALTTNNGMVQINLGPFIAQVKQQLISQGFGFANQIPAINTSFTLVESKQVARAQFAYRALNALGLWLPIIVVLLGAIGVYVAKNHRHALIGLGLGVAAGMLILGAGLAVARPIYLNAVPTDVLPHDAAGAIYDTLVRFLRDALRATALIGVVLAAGAFLTGPSETAVRTRSACVTGIGWLRGRSETMGLRTGEVGAWTYAHKRVLHIGAVVVGLAILTLIPHSTIGSVIAVTVLVLVAVGIIEFLGRPPMALTTGDAAGGAPPAIEAGASEQAEGTQPG
jgi:hypothetical protein